MGRDVIPLKYIILTQSQNIIALTQGYVFSIEGAYINFTDLLVLGSIH